MRPILKMTFYNKRFIYYHFFIFFFLFISFAKAQPRINAVSPNSAGIGAIVTIQGSGFNPTPTNNFVFFGPERAIVTAATTTSLAVKVPIGASHQLVRVTSGGYSTNSSIPFNVVSGIVLTSTSFSDRYMFTTGDSPAGIVSCDFNGDGKPEIVSGNSASGTISVLTNKSTPGIVAFEAVVNYPIKTIQEGVVVNDLNGDGKPDLVAASMEQHLVSFFINTSSGNNVSFAPRIDMYTGANSWPRSVMIFDVDNDGLNDLVVADNNKNIDWNNNNSSFGSVSIHRNTSTGGTLSFSNPVSFKGLDYVRKLAVGDLDNDNKVDLVVSSQVSHGVNIFKNNSKPGIIQFELSATILTGTNAESPSLGDLNGDGLLDMAVAHLTSGNVAILRNTSSGNTISFATKQDLPGVSCIGTAIGDLNGDGKPELVVPYYGARKVSVYKNISSGNQISFDNALDYPSGDNPVEVAIGDIDGDGLPDLSLTCSTEDKVAILKMSGAPPATKVDLGKDTLLCKGDSLLLKANLPNASFKWSNGAETSSIWVKETGSYWVRTTVGISTVYDTIAVNFSTPPSLNLGNDTSICALENKVLRAGISNATYLWNNGSDLDSLKVTSPGTYWLQIKKDGCSVKDSISIRLKASPLVNLGSDTTLCKGTNLELEVFHQDIAFYRWQDGSINSQFHVTQPGVFNVQVVGVNGCINADTINILPKSVPSISWGTDTVLCGNSLTLSPQVSDGSVIWWNGATTPTITVTVPGIYRLIAQNICGKVEEEISVIKGICDFYMPNAFTPNGDGKNDLFRAKNAFVFKTFQLKVYNRWGQIIYASNSNNEGWDGTYLNKFQPSGNYVWMVWLTNQNGQKRFYKGNVILIR